MRFITVGAVLHIFFMPRPPTIRLFGFYHDMRGIDIIRIYTGRTEIVHVNECARSRTFASINEGELQQIAMEAKKR